MLVLVHFSHALAFNLVDGDVGRDKRIVRVDSVLFEFFRMFRSERDDEVSPDAVFRFDNL